MGHCLFAPVMSETAQLSPDFLLTSCHARVWIRYNWWGVCFVTEQPVEEEGGVPWEGRPDAGGERALHEPSDEDVL